MFCFFKPHKNTCPERSFQCPLRENLPHESHSEKHILIHALQGSKSFSRSFHLVKFLEIQSQDTNQWKPSLCQPYCSWGKLDF